MFVPAPYNQAHVPKHMVLLTLLPHDNLQGTGRVFGVVCPCVLVASGAYSYLPAVTHILWLVHATASPQSTVCTLNDEEG